MGDERTPEELAFIERTINELVGVEHRIRKEVLEKVTERLLNRPMTDTLLRETENAAFEYVRVLLEEDGQFGCDVVLKVTTDVSDPGRVHIDLSIFGLRGV